MDSRDLPCRPDKSLAKMAKNFQKFPMRVSATEAKNRFGSLSAHAKREPVFVEKAGQLDTVIISAEHYYVLQTNQLKLSRAARKKKFEAEFGDWITAENARFEANGIPGADLRPW